MNTPRLSFSGSTLATRTAAITVAGALAASLAGFGATPAQSAPATDCPEAAPLGEVTKGQPVNGLTVSTGTDPEPFTGTVLGVLEDGIMPGLDMIMVRLTSSEIDRVGIWSGMSGSPVYDDQGRLIGAVSYGLAFGPSTVAGVTPAEDMLALLDQEADVDFGKMNRKVEIPARMADRIVARGDATAKAVDAGMTQLKLPFGISGLGNQKRFDQVTAKFDHPELKSMRLMRMGKAALDGEAVAPQAGGNLASSLAYGDITAAAVGTATLVCGDEVVGFGHPMTWSGPATMTLHGADALYIQEDPTFPGFKVANVGAPLGTIDQDRMAGIAGFTGDLPATSLLSSTVSKGSKSRDGETHVSVPEWLPDFAFSHLIANLDRIFDAIAKGGSELSWTMTGTRADGSPFSLSRSDRYASRYDITFETAWDEYIATNILQYNEAEEITIDSVDSTATLTEQYRQSMIQRVTVRQPGGWVPLNRENRITLKAGKTAKIRVVLRSVGEPSGPARVLVELPVPKRDAGKRGSLRVTGGDSMALWAGIWNRRNAEPSFDDLLSALESAPRNDEVVAMLRYAGRGEESVTREQRIATDIVVGGNRNGKVRIVR
jgi:hypothetical protein